MNQTNPQNYQNMYQPGQEPPKKKHVGCIIAFVVLMVLFLILAVLAAILVPAMIGYVRKSRTALANRSAKQCYQAAQTAAYEVYEEEDDPKGVCILTNIPGKSDVNAPEELRAAYDSSYTPDSEDTFLYFCVVKDGSAVYAAACNAKYTNIIGTYPNQTEAGHSVTAYDGSELEAGLNDESTFRRMFDDACQSVELPEPTAEKND